MEYTFYAMLGYVLGSIPFGYLIPHWLKGVDVRKLSRDGNPGTANAFLFGGFFCGCLVLIFDLTKGALPLFLAARNVDVTGMAFALIMAAPVVGHAYPVFEKTKGGGKAIAVSFGVLLGLMPFSPCLFVLAFWYLFYSLVIVIKPHSLRTIAAYFCWTVSELFLQKNRSMILGVSLIAAVVIRRHFREVRALEQKEIRILFGKG